MMPEIRLHVASSSPEIELADIHIPSDQDLGTGELTIFLAIDALTAAKPIAFDMVNAPIFQISVTIDPSGDVVVLLGRDQPVATRTFVVPPETKPVPPHTLRVAFADWAIVGATLDELPLPAMSDPPEPVAG